MKNINWELVFISVVVIFILGFSDYQVGFADYAIKTSENDLNNMLEIYNFEADVLGQPHFNISEIPKDLISSRKDTSLTTLIALKNEGTLTFSIYHAAIVNSPSLPGLAWAKSALTNSASRELALQQEAHQIKSNTPLVYFSLILMGCVWVFEWNRLRKKELKS